MLAVGRVSVPLLVTLMTYVTLPSDWAGLGVAVSRIETFGSAAIGIDRVEGCGVAEAVEVVFGVVEVIESLSVWPPWPALTTTENVTVWLEPWAMLPVQ